MIISERHLFKGLVKEAPSNGDILFHRGHALAAAIGAGGVISACLFVLLLLS